MSEQPENVELGESMEEKNVFVVDPDDYQKTRKLKAINDSKQHFRDLQESKPNTAGSKEWQGVHSRMAEAVALYGSELLPLIDDAIEKGILSESDLNTQHGSIREFIQFDGRFPDHDKQELKDPRPIVFKEVYRELNHIERKLGLGLEMQEDKGSAEI